MEKIFAKSVKSTGFIREFCRMAEDSYRAGYNECNGGNLSYRIKPEEINEINEKLHYHDTWEALGICAENLAGEFFLITGKGKLFRNIKGDPEANIGIIEIDKTGKRYRTVWGLSNGAVPTSELPSHILNHSVKKEVSKGDFRVIFHAHPANLIALTFILPLDEKVFTRELWEMMPECPLTFPKGIGLLPWMLPGKADIAGATSKLMEEYDVVVWAQHGVFCSGTDLDKTFGLMESIEKAAEILIKVLSAGGTKRQTVTLQNLKDLSDTFDLNLPPKFLF